jgi:CDP-diacylglycerol--glycerol-3-phosphate 3-phosphatidyltransferase
MINLANLLTLSRLLLTPLIIYTIYIGWSINSALLFGLAAVTDWLDGYFARSQDQESAFGKIFDPLVDRIFISSVVIAIVVLRQTPPLWAAALLLARDLVLMVSGQFIFIKTGKRIEINFIGKFATAVLMFSIPFIIIGWPIAQTSFMVGLALSYLAAIFYFLEGFKFIKNSSIF